MATLTPTRPRPRLTTDVAELLALAERLNGRPVPGVRMTERQFVEWGTPAPLPAEWVDREVYLTGTPSLLHQLLSGWLYRVLIGFVEFHDLGTVLIPPTTRLAEVPSRRDPDSLFVARSRLHLLRDNHLEGPPDLAVVEVVSPDSTERDWQTKHAEYAAAGLREYWIVDPLVRQFRAYTLSRKKFRPILPDDDGRVHSKVLKGMYVRPAWLWRSPLPSVAGVLEKLGL